MKCNSRKEKSCLSLEEFVDCNFSGKYFVCCGEAKNLQILPNASFDLTMLYLRVKILLYFADIFRVLTMNEDIVDLVGQQQDNSAQKKSKKPRHIYQNFSRASNVQIGEKNKV